MMISCGRPRRLDCEHGQASARPRGAPAWYQVINDQWPGRATPLLPSAPRPAKAGNPPFAPTRASQKTTLFTPAHHGQGKISARFGCGWNRGTGLEPMRDSRKPLIELIKFATGTVEPWNRIFPIHIHAHARAEYHTFHGSTVPERYIDRCFQWVEACRTTVPARFHGSRINNRGDNGR